MSVRCKLDMNRPAPETASIAAGAASALGASVCCVLPLVLVAIGVGSAQARYDPEKVSAEALAKTLSEAGFPAKVKP